MNEEQATESARNLLKRMRGKGWEYKVWEDEGWYYYMVFVGPLSVHPYGDEEVKGEKYQCLCEESLKKSERGIIKDYEWYTDPNQAVEQQIKIAREYVDKLNSVVKYVEKRIK